MMGLEKPGGKGPMDDPAPWGTEQVTASVEQLLQVDRDL